MGPGEDTCSESNVSGSAIKASLRAETLLQRQQVSPQINTGKRKQQGPQQRSLSPWQGRGGEGKGACHLTAIINTSECASSSPCRSIFTLSTDGLQVGSVRSKPLSPDIPVRKIPQGSRGLCSYRAAAGCPTVLKTVMCYLDVLVVPHKPLRKHL